MVCARYITTRYAVIRHRPRVIYGRGTRSSLTDDAFPPLCHPVSRSPLSLSFKLVPLSTVAAIFTWLETRTITTPPTLAIGNTNDGEVQPRANDGEEQPRAETAARDAAPETSERAHLRTVAEDPLAELAAAAAQRLARVVADDSIAEVLAAGTRRIANEPPAFRAAFAAQNLHNANFVRDHWDTLCRSPYFDQLPAEDIARPRTLVDAVKDAGGH